MSATVGELNIKLNLELARLDAQIKQSNQKIAKMGLRMNSDMQKAARAIKATLGSLGVGVSVGALVRFSKQVLDLGGEITDLANQANIGTDAFQVFAAVGKESGVTGEQVASAFNKMSQTIQDAAEGSKTAVESLGKLQLTAAGLKALKPEEQFTLIAAQIQAATDKEQAFNAALEVLGAKNAPKLREVLQRLGTEGFGALAEETKNVRFTPDQLKSLDEAGDALQRVADALKVIAANTIIDVMPKKGQSLKGSLTESKWPWTNPITGGLKAAASLGGKFWDRAQETAVQNGADPAKIFADDKTKSDAAKFAQDAAKHAAAIADATALRERARVADELAAEARLKLAEETENLAVKQSLLDAEGSKLLYDQQVRNEMIAEGARLFAETITPLERYADQLKRVNELEKAGAITGYQAARIRADMHEKLQGDARNITQVRFDTEGVSETPDELLKDWTVFEKQMFDIFDSVGDRAASTFADMVLSGENAFKSLADVAAKAVLEMAARLMVINPLINMVFGLSGTAALPTIMTAFGGGRASGGPVQAGMLYRVNENGPEYFQPNVDGMIIPNHKLTQAGNGRAPLTLIYNVQAGVSRAELIPILRQHSELTIGEIRRRDRQRR